jgi:alpha-glucosidase (family GH31 glycosyl hydrolase)
MSHTASPFHHRNFCAVLFAISLLSSLTWAEVKRIKHAYQGTYLIVEILDNDLVHLEYGKGMGPVIANPIQVSPMVKKTDYTGPSAFTVVSQDVIETADLKLTIDNAALSATFVDKTANNAYLTTITPMNLGQPWKGFSATRSAELDVYGLGQQFLTPGTSDIDWDGRVREGGPYGNIMANFNDGANGNTQIPVMYGVNGTSGPEYALFLDNKYKQRWDFTGSSQWKAEMWGDEVRLYLMSGPSLQDLRHDYMELTGYPPVPPKKMFGLWLSEYGYDNWTELENVLASMRSNKFPLDGFVLDLQWFGGIKADSDSTRMGCLTFDTVKFPQPVAKIKYLDTAKGIGIMCIEEAYIGKALPEHTDLKNRGYLVRDVPDGTNPVYLDNSCTHNTWWGKGGILDYTSDSCGKYWHDAKRQALVNAGVIGHWTDLGEPELYAAMFCQNAGGYADGTEADAHNIFNFKWLSSIYNGYTRNGVQQRPFMMSRSGAAGMQRFGAAMWSGDISSHLSSLAAHWANQMHMSLSGIDYYGADIGGFHRRTPSDQLDEMYTQWFGYGMLFDIPGRPHTENLQNNKYTEPDKIGHKASNLANARLRYALIPYVYSLAHIANRTGEALMPPLVFYYQNDINVRSLGHEKMIGQWLLAAPAAKAGEQQRDVYLPAGTWYDFHTGKKTESSGEWIPKVALYRNGIFTVPLYARAGAIVPLMYVDDKTLNALGKRSDGTRRDELIARIFPAGENNQSEFTLYEDDGVSIAYLSNQVRTTRLTQSRANDTLTVTILPVQGSYQNAPTGRKSELQVLCDKTPRTVSLNHIYLPKLTSSSSYAEADSGWYFDATKKCVFARAALLNVQTTKKFVFAMDTSDQCKSQYDCICVAGAGNGWNPNDPERMLSRESCVNKVWKRDSVIMSAERFKFTANGSWTVNWGSNGKQDGPDFPALAKPGYYNVSWGESNPSNAGMTYAGPVEGGQSVSAHVVCANGTTTFGISVYVVGNIPELGSWNPDNAVKLEPDGPYPMWTGTIGNLPPSTLIEWKCIKRIESGNKQVTQWEPGANNTFTTPASGSAGDQKAQF